MPRLPHLICVLMLLVPSAAFAEEAVPKPWTIKVKKMDGNARRFWHLAMDVNADSRDVGITVAPVAIARRVHDADGAKERSTTGDMWQMSAWAETLRKTDAWKRPTLRNPPSFSAHVVGIVRSLVGAPSVENLDYGVTSLSVGDLIFVKDTVVTNAASQLRIQLLANGKRDDKRAGSVVLFGASTCVELHRHADRLRLRLHSGMLAGITPKSSIDVVVGGSTLLPSDAARFIVRRKESVHLDVHTGHVALARGVAGLIVPQESSLEIHPSGTLRLSPYSRATWSTLVPAVADGKEPEALGVASRLLGLWLAENGSIRLNDDGSWNSVNRPRNNMRGTWAPRPGGIAELTRVWTPYRSKQQTTETFRYIQDGDALVRLTRAGKVMLLRGK